MKSQYIPEKRLMKFVRPWSKIIFVDRTSYVRYYYLDTLDRCTAAYVCPDLLNPRGYNSSFREWKVSCQLISEDSHSEDMAIGTEHIMIDNQYHIMTTIAFSERFMTSEECMEFVDERLSQRGYVLMDKQHFFGLL